MTVRCRAEPTPTNAAPIEKAQSSIACAAEPDHIEAGLRRVAVPAGGTQAVGVVAPAAAALDAVLADMGKTILLWGMVMSRQTGVPVGLLASPWTAPANDFEKYFEPQTAAIWAVAAAGQKDVATVGALTALTGERFAYDIGRWRSWWESTEKGNSRQRQ